MSKKQNLYNSCNLDVIEDFGSIKKNISELQRILFCYSFVKVTLLIIGWYKCLTVFCLKIILQLKTILECRCFWQIKVIYKHSEHIKTLFGSVHSIAIFFQNDQGAEHACLKNACK